MTVTTSYTVPALQLRVPPLLSISATGLFLGLGCILYAVMSQPTPDSPGLTEVAIAACLAISALSAGAHHALNPMSLARRRPPWLLAGTVYLVYALSIPLVIGMMYGNGLKPIARDLAGLVFWALPVIYACLFTHPGQARMFKNIVIWALVVIGLCFSMRFLTALYTVTGTLTLAPSDPDILLELVNVPSVLFAALFLFGNGLVLVANDTLRHKVSGLLCLALASLPVLAGICALQRANMGALMAMSFLLLVLQVTGRPVRSLWSVGVISALVLIFAPSIQDILFLMIEKTRLVGFNMRFEEAEAIFIHMERYKTALVTGMGWGASFISPAAGFTEINFTHNFFMTHWLKLGLAGLALGTVYVFLLLKPVIRSALMTFKAGPDGTAREHDMVLALSVLFPVLINLFLYANHKSFDFGLLLLLAAILSPWGRIKSR